MVSAAQGYLGNHSLKEGQAGLDAGLKANIDEFRGYALPIGWNISRDRDWGSWAGFGFLSLVGWFITASAVSLGAPFWFDMLNKIIVVRSTIKPHEKSPEERSKN
jgi:hypothetical protein